MDNPNGAAEIIASDQAAEITSLFEVRYQTEPSDLLVTTGAGRTLGEVLQLGDALTANDTYALVYATGSFVDPFAKSPDGSPPVEGKTAFLIVRSDGTLLGGGLYVEDLSESIREAFAPAVHLMDLHQGR